MNIFIYTNDTLWFGFLSGYVDRPPYLGPLKTSFYDLSLDVIFRTLGKMCW